MFRLITSCYKRWRHGCGFGVHSPLAYRLITEVLHAPRRCALYDEPRAAAVADRYDYSRSRARMLLRLIAWAHPATIHICGSAQPYADIAAMACPRAAITHASAAPDTLDSAAADFIIIAGPVQTREPSNHPDPARPATRRCIFADSGSGIDPASLPGIVIYNGGRHYALSVTAPGLSHFTLDARF